MESADIVALCVGGVIALGIIVYLVVNEKKKLSEWLIWAVSEAEKLLGEKTGQLKLRTVYAWFTEKFPVIAAILPFRVFSAWVDTALVTLRKWLETGNPIGDYITGGNNGNVHE